VKKIKEKSVFVYMKWLVRDRPSVDASVAIAAQASSISVTVMIVYGKCYARVIKKIVAYVLMYAAGNSLKRM